MTGNCPQPGDLTEAAVGRILTQYRESPNLLDLVRAVLRQAEEAVIATCAVPSFFDIESAVGDQLTLLGKRMGFPRCHCICDVQPVFGFECDGFPNNYQIVGFCDQNGNWADCGPFGTSEVCIRDDETYRRFLFARRYQMRALFDMRSLTLAARHLFGSQAIVISSGLGRVVIAPGRPLTAGEMSLLQVFPRVLPVAPGIRIRFHFGPTRVFGFGEGWGGFCEEWEPDGLMLVTENGQAIVGATCEGEGEEEECETFSLMTGPLTRDAPFLCEVDVKPYDCI